MKRVDKSGWIYQGGTVHKSSGGLSLWLAAVTGDSYCTLFTWGPPSWPGGKASAFTAFSLRSFPGCFLPGDFSGLLSPWGVFRVAFSLGIFLGYFLPGDFPGLLSPWGFFWVTFSLGIFLGYFLPGDFPGLLSPWGFSWVTFSLGSFLRLLSPWGFLGLLSPWGFFRVAFSVGSFPGRVVPVTSKLALQWRPCQAPGAKGQRRDWLTLCKYTVTGWDRKPDLQLLSQCGST